MHSQLSDGNHQLLMQRARQLIEDEYAAQHRRWSRERGLIFKICRIFAFITAFFNLLIFMVYALGCWLKITDMPNGIGIGAVKSSLRLTVGCMAFLAAGIVLMWFKKHLFGAAACWISGIPMLIHMCGELGLFTDFNRLFFVHLLPITVLLGTTLYMFITVITDRRRIVKRYNSIIDNIYRSRPNTDAIMTEQEWSEYIRNYVETPEKRKLKRSLRHKQRKQAAAEQSDADTDIADEE